MSLSQRTLHLLSTLAETPRMSARFGKASVEVTGARSWHTRKSRPVPIGGADQVWWMDRGTTKRREGRTQDIGEDGAFVFANACPFGELRSASKSSFSFSPESNVRLRTEADGKVRVVEPNLRTQGMRVTREIYERGGVTATSPS